MKFSGTVTEVKKLAALNSAVDKTAGGREPTAGAFFSRNKPKRWATEKKGWKVQPNQCFWCLNFGHMVQKCPSREKGEDPKPRPDGSLYKGRFPKGGEGTKSFQSFCFVSEANRPPGGPWLVDSGCNRHMTPVKGDLSNMQPSNIEYTLGNKEKLSAKCSGEAQLKTTSEGGRKVKIILNDVLYVPGLPQRMFSTEKLCRHGGEFLQSARRQSVC
eukprot:251440_1